MTRKLYLDRTEGDVAVCLDEEEKEYLLPAELLRNLREGSIFSVDTDGQTYRNVFFLREETEERDRKVREKIKRLLDRSRK